MSLKERCVNLPSEVEAGTLAVMAIVFGLAAYAFGWLFSVAIGAAGSDYGAAVVTGTLTLVGVVGILACLFAIVMLFRVAPPKKKAVKSGPVVVQPDAKKTRVKKAKAGVPTKAKEAPKTPAPAKAAVPKAAG